MLEIVERARPVRRASSARLVTPSTVSVPITRPVFDSRTEPNEPYRSVSSIPGRSFTAGGAVSRPNQLRAC